MQNDEGTIATYWQSLKHLLQWSDSRPFKDAPKVLPAFPEYLLTARNERHPNNPNDKGKPLTPKYMVKVLSHARAFFDWLRLHEKGYSHITEAWTETLKVRRSAGTHSRLQERSYWKLEDVRKIAALTPSCLREKRDQAALVFLFLSGMRIGAFVTLPLECVDMKSRRVMQLPEKGVQTENDKAAVTFLLPISDLLKVVENWDAFMREKAGENVPAFNWFPAIDHTGKKVKGGLLKGKYTGREEAFDSGMKLLCRRADVPYKSPHKLRHGHGVYGVKKAKDIAQLKAISQNLMHENIGITDGIYGKLAEDDLSSILENFGE
jgi:integrase